MLLKLVPATRGPVDPPGDACEATVLPLPPLPPIMASRWLEEGLGRAAAGGDSFWPAAAGWEASGVKILRGTMGTAGQAQHEVVSPHAQAALPYRRMQLCLDGC